MRFVAFNVDGGYTELCERNSGDFVEILNSQLLLDEEAKDLTAFKKKLAECLKEYDVSSILILKIDTSFEPVYFNI